jgi:phage-related minor tail protein
LGNVFNQGRMVAFAGGGIIDRPTIFPMKNGAGLMGEAGPEAIMPLRRTRGGALGVVAAGGGGAPVININVHQVVQALDQKSFNDRLAMADSQRTIIDGVHQGIEKSGLLRKSIASASRGV